MPQKTLMNANKLFPVYRSSHVSHNISEKNLINASLMCHNSKRVSNSVWCSNTSRLLICGKNCIYFWCHACGAYGVNKENVWGLFRKILKWVWRETFERKAATWTNIHYSWIFIRCFFFRWKFACLVQTLFTVKY